MRGSGMASAASVKISVAWTPPRRTKAHRCCIEATRAAPVAVMPSSLYLTDRFIIRACGRGPGGLGGCESVQQGQGLFSRVPHPGGIARRLADDPYPLQQDEQHAGQRARIAA